MCFPFPPPDTSCWESAPQQRMTIAPPRSERRENRPLKPAKELAIAAGSGNVARVREMLDEAPELAKDWQPIMDACFFGRAEIVRLLLERGADPDVMAKTNYRYR